MKTFSYRSKSPKYYITVQFLSYISYTHIDRSKYGYFEMHLFVSGLSDISEMCFSSSTQVCSNNFYCQMKRDTG